MYALKQRYAEFVVLGLALLCHGATATAREARHVVTPESSEARATDTGHRARTHVKLLMPAGGLVRFNARIEQQATPAGSPPSPGFGFQTPASLS